MKIILRKFKVNTLLVLFMAKFIGFVGAQHSISPEIDSFFSGPFNEDWIKNISGQKISDSNSTLFIQTQINKFNFELSKLQLLSKEIENSNKENPLSFTEKSIYGLQHIVGVQKQEGLAYLYENSNESKRSRNLFKSFIAFSDLSFAYLLLNELDSCAHYAALSYQEIIRQNKPGLQQMALNFQSDILLLKGQLEGSITKKLQVVQLAVKEENDFMKSNAYRDIALISLMIGNLDQATQYVNQLDLLNLKQNKADKQREIDFIRNILKVFQDSNTELGFIDSLEHTSFSAPSKLNLIKAFFVAERLLEDENYSQSMLYAKSTLDECLDPDFFKFKPYLRRVHSESKYHLNLQDTTLKTVQSAMLFYGFNEYQNLKSLKFLLLLSEKTNKIGLSNLLMQSFINNKFYGNLSLNKRIEKLTEGNLREEREKLIEKQSEKIQSEKIEKERIAFEGQRKVIIVVVSLVFSILGIVILLLRIRTISSKQKQKEAELSQVLLRSQMNPHFVFNAMSVIQSYIYANDQEKSSKFLVNFSRLMRLILENSSKEMISLELEKEILDKYITTQKMRFQDRFEYQLIFDQDLVENRAMIPPMIAQPFIENSIEHGQLHSLEDGKIVVEVKKMKHNIQLVITDNGIGRKASSSTKKLKSHKSMAIGITQQRIQSLNTKFKVKSTITIEDLNRQDQSGTKVTILLPLKYE